MSLLQPLFLFNQRELVKPYLGRKQHTNKLDLIHKQPNIDTERNSFITDLLDACITIRIANNHEV